MLPDGADFKEAAHRSKNAANLQRTPPLLGAGVRLVFPKHPTGTSVYLSGPGKQGTLYLQRRQMFVSPGKGRLSASGFYRCQWVKETSGGFTDDR